jgi:hypothetical protein
MEPQRERHLPRRPTRRFADEVPRLGREGPVLGWQAYCSQPPRLDLQIAQSGAHLKRRRPDSRILPGRRLQPGSTHSPCHSVLRRFAHSLLATGLSAVPQAGSPDPEPGELWVEVIQQPFLPPGDSHRYEPSRFIWSRRKSKQCAARMMIGRHHCYSCLSASLSASLVGIQRGGRSPHAHHWVVSAYLAA